MKTLALLFILCLLLGCIEYTYHDVTYEVTGTALSAGVTFRTEHESAFSIADAPLPWSLELSIKEGNLVYLIATNNQASGQITASIKYDGEILAEETSLYPTVTAEVMGYLP